VKIEEYLTDEVVLSELGARLGRTRLERNLSQRELADEAGVERKAVQRIEAGEPVKLTSFIRVLRALGLLDALDRLVPEPLPSPIELLRLHGKRRRRASGARRKQTPDRGEAPGRGKTPGQGRRSGREGEKTPPAEKIQPAQGAPAPWRWGDETPAAGA
jgi:transcriptional regulator with XRE-family HTH domain